DTPPRGEKILRREADTDKDGRLESIATFEKGKERKQTRDDDGDGKEDLVILLDADGRKIREEADAKHDGRRELVRIFEGGKRVREDEDQDGDGKPEVVTTWDGDTPLRREAD